MQTVAERLRWLAWLGPRTATRALVATWPHAGPDERPIIWNALLARARAERRPDALAALVDATVQATPLPATPGILDQLIAVIAARADHAALLETWLADPCPFRRAAVAALLPRLDLANLAPALIPLLADPHLRVADAAAATLLTLARVPPLSEWGLQQDAHPSALVRAVHAAAGSFAEHRRQESLAALAALSARAAHSPLPAWLDDPEHAALLALRRYLRRDPDPTLRAVAWRWLKHRALASAAAERLAAPLAPSASSSPADHRLARRDGLPGPDHLAAWHLALHPARAAALAALLRPDGSWPTTLIPDHNDPAAPLPRRLGTIRLIQLIPAAPRRRDAALATLLTDPEPAARHAAVRAAAALPSRASSLLDFAFDPDPRVRRSAALAVLNQPERGMVRDALRDNVLTALRRLPSRPQLPDLQIADRLRLRRELAARPDAPIPELRSALRASDPVRAALALQHLRALGLVDRLLPDLLDRLAQLLASAHTHDQPALARLAATLTAALGDARAPSIVDRLLDLAIEPAGEPRLRSNALDGLIKRARTDPASRPAAAAASRTLAAAEPHRLRATALRGCVLLAADSSLAADPRRALAAMLRDERPEHRLAALWLSERLARPLASSPEIVDAVDRLAVHARGPVRARAQRASDRLRLEVRLGWSRRARPVTDTAADSQEAAA